MENSRTIVNSYKYVMFVILFASMTVFFGITRYTYSVNLPETGQTTCYLA